MRLRIGFVRAAGAMTRRLGPAIIMATAMLGAMDARATVVTGAFSGVINYGRDYAGVFGAANATLDGVRYTGSFTYDTSKGNRYTTATVDEVSGGDSIHTDSVLTYALTINGITDQIDVSDSSFVTILGDHEFRLGAQSVGGGASATVAEVADGAAFDNLDAPISFADTVDGLGSPYFGVVQRLGAFGRVIYYVNFDTERVDFAGDGVSSGAPEPAAWAMLLAGFLAVGGALRRQNRFSAKIDVAHVR